MNIKIYSSGGQLVQQSQAVATGFVQKIIIDIQQSRIATGMYMIIAEGANTKTFKVVKR